MRPPDFIIGPKETPYMHRWFLIPRNKWFNIYLHHILRSDDDRALHDHPWYSLSFVLKGVYLEIRPNDAQVYWRWSLIWRKATHTHRLVVVPGETVWTLFITGPRIRDWGFHCPKGWVPWQKFVKPSDRGNVGIGCGEMS